eukprot:gnl/TRDRNA2_/TRDRNA2_184981_c0_seq1.p2 gnl/TRDRNA2_/TRDRNA2_184981_c0~~gnl/TRDRNA2_/TRDRNA2_184981_c0_seq1.p2  ORF type:complete len:111 (-),score=20.56 gnl/TRDRNA2_/TRDRNA2_184981_c0_seq1:244-576(-)
MTVFIIFDIIVFLLSPPLLYVWLVLAGIMAIIQAYKANKEKIDPIIFAILDVISAIIVAIVNCFKAIYHCIQRTVYPIKQSILGCCDDLDYRMNPWKKKTPYSHIPTFSY